MHNVHSGLSVIAKLQPDKIEDARSYLKELNKDPANNTGIPFGKSQNTHFATGVIIPEQDYHGEKLPATLLLATSFSGPRNDHIDELIDFGSEGLRGLFQYCMGFPQEAMSSDAELKKFIKKHRRWDTFYTGMQFISHTDVIRENELRNTVEDFLDNENSVNGFDKLKPGDVRKKIQNYIKTKPEFKWALAPQKKSIQNFLVLYFPLIITALLLTIVLIQILISPIMLFFSNSIVYKIGSVLFLLLPLKIGFLLYKIRSYENEKQFLSPRLSDDKVKFVSCSQNHPVINEMSVFGPFKKGKLRPLIYFLALKAVNLIRGTLVVPTVATARWLTIDGGKRLVFISNFTNLSESYVRDFIDNKSSAAKINLLFGQANGYPITKWMTGKGALTDPNTFMNSVLQNQQVTEFWYCPYPNLTIDNININHKIRTGLSGNLSEIEIQKWLKLL